jgi:release factor glutamine methyltransferase
MNKNVLDYEPADALFVPEDDPLIFYKRILEVSDGLLAVNGKIYFEINEQFGAGVAGLFNRNGFTAIRILRDIHGKDRFVCGLKSAG